MARHANVPLQTVTTCHLTAGPRGGLRWQITLACGHQSERIVGKENRQRIAAGEPPAAPLERARCDQCAREQRERRIAKAKAEEAAAQAQRERERHPYRYYPRSGSATP